MTLRSPAPKPAHANSIEGPAPFPGSERTCIHEARRTSSAPGNPAPATVTSSWTLGRNQHLSVEFAE
jgi:hypothetical protein